MNKLSVALAVYNEESNLTACLESVKDIADEIVVVDGGSTDKTVEIAKRFGAKVIQADNPPIFHINKQKAIDACTGDWILQLDADEVISKELKKEVVDVSRSKTDISGYWIPRKNYLLGKWLKKGGAHPDYVIRFFRKGKGSFPCKSVHEQIEIDGEVGYLKNNLIHNAYPTFSEYIRKANTYTTLTAKMMKKAGIIEYLFIKPTMTFFRLFFRHKGFMDRFPGFVWAFFSALHYPIAYIKYRELKTKEEEPSLQSE